MTSQPTGPDFAGEYTPRHCGFCAREFKTRGARVTHENRCWTEQRIRASVVAAVAAVEREDAARVQP